MSATFCRALTIREGLTSSAHMDSDKSNKMIRASFFCCTFCGSFSQVGPANPTMPTTMAVNIKPRSQRPERGCCASNSTASNSLLIALRQPLAPLVRLNQYQLKGSNTSSAANQMGRRKWNSSNTSVLQLPGVLPLTQQIGQQEEQQAKQA